MVMGLSEAVFKWEDETFSARAADKIVSGCRKVYYPHTGIEKHSRGTTFFAARCENDRKKRRGSAPFRVSWIRQRENSEY